MEPSAVSYEEKLIITANVMNKNMKQIYSNIQENDYLFKFDMLIRCWGRYKMR